MTDTDPDFLEGVDQEDLLFPKLNEPPEMEPVPAYRGRQYRELTEDLVSQLRSAGKSITYYDTRVRGLVLKTKAHGAQSYQFNGKGRGRKSKLGSARSMTLDDARARAKRLSQETEELHPRDDDYPVFETRSATRRVPLSPEGLNPNRKVADLFELYAERGMGHLNTSWREQLTSLFHREILPALGHHRAELIGTELLSRHFDSVAYRHSEGQAARCRKALSAMFGWAEKANLVGLNPVRGTQGFPQPLAGAVNSVADLAAAYRHADYLPPQWASIVRLHILTGLSLNKVRCLDIDQVDLAGAELAISPDLVSQILPLSEVALTELECAIGQREFGPVFPSNVGSHEHLGPNSRILRAFNAYLRQEEAATFTPRNTRQSIIEALRFTGENPKMIEEGLRGKLEVYLSPQRRTLHPLLLWNTKLLAEAYPPSPSRPTAAEVNLAEVDL